MKTGLKKVPLLAFVLALAFSFARVAGAQTVLIDQQPDQINGLFSDSDCDFCNTGIQVIAEDFIVTTNVTIGQIVIWGGYFPANVPLLTDNFTVIFHADAAGVPGAEVAPPEANVPSTRVDTGIDLFGVDEYEFTLTLASPVTLTPGTYWVEIYNDSTGSTESVFWETGSLDPVNGIDGIGFAFEAPGVTWFNAGGLNQSLRLQLVTVAPLVEVPTMNIWGLVVLMIMAGSLALVVLRRKTTTNLE